MKIKTTLIIFISLIIALNIKAEEFQKIFKPIQEIRLQQNVKKIIGSIHDLFLDNNLFYIVDSKSGDIKIYNLDGKLIKTVGNKGNGPGEFQIPSAIYVDEKLIYITDIGNRRLNIFDKPTFTFKKSFFIVDGGSIRVTNNKIMLGYADIENKKSLHIYDYNGKLLDNHIDVPKITLDNQLVSDLTSFAKDINDNIYFVHEMKYEVIKGKNNKYNSFITREGDKYYIAPPQKLFQNLNSKEENLKWINSWSHINKLIVSKKSGKLLISFNSGNKIYLDIYDLNGKVLYKNVESNMRLLFADEEGYIYFLQEMFNNNTVEFVVKKYSFI